MVSLNGIRNQKSDSKTKNGYTEKPQTKNVTRTSPITDILSNPENLPLRNFLLAILLSYTVNNLLVNCFKHGKFTLKINALTFGFEQFHYIFPIWTLLFVISLICHPALKIWLDIYKVSNVATRFFWRNFGIISIGFYYSFFIITAPLYVVNFNLPPLTAFVILMETVRFIMKIHSFTVETISQLLYDPQQSNIENTYPTFSSYLYFSFAPVLVFKKEYARTQRIRIGFVIKCFVEMALVTLLMALLYEKIANDLEDACIVKSSYSMVLLKIFENYLVCFGLLAGFGYVFLHAWSNLTGEVLMFGDRLFYKNWWSSDSYLNWYRLWNVLVQDWLYNYIYKPSYENYTRNSKYASRIIVFFISALFHEYVLGFSMRLFFPLNFIVFFFGSVLQMYFPLKSGNIWFLYTIGLGFSMQIVLYTLEYYASSNCDVNVDSFFIPKFIQCNCLEF